MPQLPVVSTFSVTPPAPCRDRFAAGQAPPAGLRDEGFTRCYRQSALQVLHYPVVRFVH